METYDEIYGRMKNAYEHETGDSFNEVSDIAIRLKVSSPMPRCAWPRRASACVR